MSTSINSGGGARPLPSIADMSQHMLQRFDPNGTGSVALSGDAANDPLLAAADKIGNADGTVTQAEIGALLTQFDASADGTLDRAEFKTMATQLGLKPPPGHGPGGFGGPGGHGGPGGFGMPHTIADMVSHHIQRMDANGDGAIDIATEAANAPDKGARLAQADTDGDGKVTAAELTAQISSHDTNGDGTIDRSEMEAMRPAGAPAPGGSIASGGGAGASVDASSTQNVSSLTATLSGLIEQLKAMLASLTASAAAVQPAATDTTATDATTATTDAAAAAAALPTS